MPTKMKRSPARKAASPKAKAKMPTLKLKAPAKKSVSSTAQKGKKPPTHSNLLRQILEARNQTKGAPLQPYMNHRGSQPPPGKHLQFARFAGPRKRAA